MNVAVLHAGGLGDLVLAETLIAGLRERHPGAHVTLFCRADVAPVAWLYARPPDAIRTFTFDPYRWALPADAARMLAPFLAELPREPVDLFVAAELKSTWLAEVLATALHPREAIVAGGADPPRSDLLVLLRLLQLKRNRDARRPQPADGGHELDRYARLAGVARRTPSLRRDGPSEDETAPLIVVFPAGAPDLKRWSRESMRNAAERIAAARHARVVVVGAEHERSELDALAQEGPASPAFEVVTGTPNDLPRIAALIARASGYVGIDTGLAHLAAAYGVPGVTVYGGGTWPSYAPWSASSAGVVAPIPCFGCQWDCAFDRAFCIERIGPDSVVATFERVAGATGGGPVVDAIKAYDAEERTILASAAAVHRAAQADRAARLRAIIRLQDVFHGYIRRARNRQAHATEALNEMTTRVAAAAHRLTQRRKDR